MGRWGVLAPMPIRMEKEPQTAFQQWINPALKRAGISLKGLAVAVGMDYTALWKIARGKPSVYPGSSRPEYENAVKIGERLGDVDGALRAAGYTTDESTTPEDAALLSKWHALPPESQALVSALVEQLAARHR